MIALWLAATASAQFNASIQGTVTDNAGAVVSGATVTVTNQETNKQQSVTTSDNGFYRVTGLPPGTYTVSAELAGFRKKTLENIVLRAEAPQGVDLALEAGEVSETVTITADTTQPLQTESANITGAITNDEIRRIPQVGRSPYELLRLTPGVFGSGARNGSGQAVNLPNTTGPGGSNLSIFQTENQVPISANGQRVSANNYQIDGVSVNSLGFGGAAVVTPNQESVKEIRVISSSYSAEDGRNSGAQIKVVSQNGTNEFHGSALFKYNDPALNAFNKYGGVTGNPLINAPPTRVENRFRQFGGSLGGPILKEKLFFFFSYEGLRNKTNNTFDSYIETPEYRQLVINQRPGSAVAQIFQTPGVEPRIISVLPSDCSVFGNDPNRCRVVPGGLDIGSLTGATGQYVSLGNPTGGGFDGIPDILFARIANPVSQSGNQYNTRIDYSRGNSSFAASTYFTKLNNVSSDAAGRARPLADLNFQPLSSAAMANFTRIIAPTILNEARFNFTRFGTNQVQTNSDVNFGIPRIEVEGLPFDRIRFGADRSEGTPGIFAQNTYEFNDVLSWVIGNKALKFGVVIRKEQDNNALVGGARPLFSFSGLFNLANGTPIFEAINLDPRTGEPADAQRYFRTSYYAGFVQNDWKIKPNFTLNLGLRYEYFSPLTEKRGRIANLVFPAPGDLQSSRVEVSDRLYNPDRNNFAPRLGFAWSPKRFEDRVVVRGGYGLAYNRIPNVLFTNTRGNPPFFTRYNICCGTAPTDFGSPFVNGQILFALGSSNSPFSFPINPVLAQGIDPVSGGPAVGAAEIYGAEPDLRDSYAHLYSLEVQFQMPFRLAGSVGYQGSAAHKLIRIVNENFLYANNPKFFAVYFPTDDVNSSFNAMLLGLQRKFGEGFQFNANYRWSKSIDTLSYGGPGAPTNQTFPQDQSTERGPSDFDVTHYFNLSGLWDLPIFRGRKDWIGRAFGGWQLNGVFTAHTGFPWTPVTGLAVSTPGGPSLSPSRPIRYFGGALDDSSDDAFIRVGGNFPGGGTQYFDISATGRPGIGRNSFRGPKYSAVDFSLVKQTGLPNYLGLGEGANLEIRANFFNAFNSLNLTPFGFGSAEARIESPNFGRANAGLSGRVIEFQARFSF